MRLLVCALSILLAGCGGGAAAPPPAAPPATPKEAKPTASAPAKAAALTPTEIAARATPAVVAVRSEGALGSGFVVRKSGWIATNLHVIRDAESVIVVLKDGTEHAVVSIVAVDDERDLALLDIQKGDLPELALGPSAEVRPGDPVVAIGHPLGLSDTVSDGLVSAVREIDPTLTLLQISAPIAPGSSGGPLLDSRGRVIGIATAITRQGQNLAFGVPSAYLVELLEHPEPTPWAVFRAAHKRPALPAIKRAVPTHDLSLLSGCGEGDLRLLTEMIARAIEVGAPIYNSGNYEACYHVYEGAALDADRRLGVGCGGAKRALADGRRKAASAATPEAQAWAMRDAFDGLLDVIGRKLGH